MIKKIQKYEYQCENCKKIETFYNEYQGRNHLEVARANGWGISRNRYNCYCPECAIYFRNTGKMTERTMYEIKHAGETK